MGKVPANRPPARTTVAALGVSLLLALGACTSAPTVEQPSAEKSPVSAASVPAQDSSQLDATAASVLESGPSPTIGSIGGDWSVFALARAKSVTGTAIPEEYFKEYIARVESALADASEFPALPKLNESKSTENSRVALTLMALGKNPSDAAGVDLISPLADLEYAGAQGVNGTAWALVAVDAAGQTQTSAKLLKDLLGQEIRGGGFALAGDEPDPDVTAMALIALAPHKDDPAAAEVVERGIKALEAIQLDNGGFESWGTQALESVAMCVVALATLGVEPNERLTKGGGLLAAMERFRSGGAYRHTVDGDPDPIATDQALLALVASERLANGKVGLFDFSDVEDAR